MNVQQLRNNAILFGILMFACGGTTLAGETEDVAKADAAAAAEAAERRQEIDDISDLAIEELVASSDAARGLYEQAAGYAVFRATKAGLLVTGAGGSGVAVNRETNERTYMRMGSGGVGLGAGVQNYRLIVLFETAAALEKFAGGGWDTAASAQAAAGKSGVNAASSFADGIAIFQLTDKGLMAQADLTGTRFWASDKLNDM